MTIEEANYTIKEMEEWLNSIMFESEYGMGCLCNDITYDNFWYAAPVYENLWEDFPPVKLFDLDVITTTDKEVLYLFSPTVISGDKCYVTTDKKELATWVAANLACIFDKLHYKRVM